MPRPAVTSTWAAHRKGSVLPIGVGRNVNEVNGGKRHASRERGRNRRATREGARAGHVRTPGGRGEGSFSSDRDFQGEKAPPGGPAEQTGQMEFVRSVYFGRFGAFWGQISVFCRDCLTTLSVALRQFSFSRNSVCLSASAVIQFASSIEFFFSIFDSSPPSFRFRAAATLPS